MTTTTAFAPSQATTRVDVDAGDAVVDGLPTTVAGPRVFFVIRNDGRRAHRFVVAGADGEPAAETTDVHPGATTTLAARLRPGPWTAQWVGQAGGRADATAAFTVT